MTDRVKFKFWDTKEKVMINWDCVYQTAFNQLHKEGNELQRYGLMYNLFTNNLRYIPLQCTGLKDKNGNLIYEGDILRSDDYPFSTLKLNISEPKKIKDNYFAQVCWSNDSAQFFYCVFKNKNSKVVGRATGNTATFEEMPDFEIISNIYENPELLGGNNDRII